jgi:hypothetical protein
MSAYDTPDVADAVSALLRLDALSEAEKLTGQSYKDDPTTEAIGFLGHMALCEAQHQVLIAADDTTMSNEVERYDRILLSEGFQLVYSEPFVGTGYGGRNNPPATDEALNIWWHNDGLLLVYDTFGGANHHVNSAKVYYNWKPTNRDNFWSFTSSGGPLTEDGVWPGDHDARQGLRLILHNLRAHGRFLSPWQAEQWLWVLHYMDYRDSSVAGFDSRTLTAKHIAALPEHVQAAIKWR